MVVYGLRLIFSQYVLGTMDALVNDNSIKLSIVIVVPKASMRS